MMAHYHRNDWLEYGLTHLAEKGIEALTIDAMCSLLKVTKGSFYHHFTNREAYLEALLQHWEERFTKQFIEISQSGRTPQEQTAHLYRLVIETHGTSEVAIRSWAQVDPLAGTYQARVDQQRLDYLTQLQLALTGDETTAATMARMIYAILIGAQTIMPAYTREELAQVYDLLNRLGTHTRRT